MSNQSNSTASQPTITISPNGVIICPPGTVITNSQGSYFIGVSIDSIVELPRSSSKKEDKEDGCSCKKCEKFFPMSEPNQEDGTLICYSCRMTW